MMMDKFHRRLLSLKSRRSNSQPIERIIYVSDHKYLRYLLMSIISVKVVTKRPIFVITNSDHHNLSELATIIPQQDENLFHQKLLAIEQFSNNGHNLFLDADTLVTGKIDELFKSDEFAIARDNYRRLDHKIMLEFYFGNSNTIGLRKLETYFGLNKSWRDIAINSGVIAFSNCKGIKEIADKLLKQKLVVSKNRSEQLAINIWFAKTKKCRLLDEKYNYQLNGDIFFPSPSAKIIHFIREKDKMFDYFDNLSPHTSKALSRHLPR